LGCTLFAQNCASIIPEKINKLQSGKKFSLQNQKDFNIINRLKAKAAQANGANNHLKILFFALNTVCYYVF